MVPLLWGNIPVMAVDNFLFLELDCTTSYKDDDTAPTFFIFPFSFLPYYIPVLLWLSNTKEDFVTHKENDEPFSASVSTMQS